MDTNNNSGYSDPSQQVENTLRFDQDTIQTSDPLSLDIDDKELIEIIDKRIEDSKKFYKDEYNLKDRREKNEMYLFGRQIEKRDKLGLPALKDYETKSADNALYEIEASLKPLAMSKLPDIMVTPGGPDPDRIQSAKDLTVVVNDTNKQRQQREVLGLAFKHLPVYLTAILKKRWNSEKGIDGDHETVLVHPEYVVVDHTATSRNPDDMGYIAQCVPMTVQDMLMKFPNKKKEMYEELNKKGIMVGNEPTYKDMASEVKVWEVWFDWYKKKGDKDLVNKEQAQYEALLEPGVKWEKISGVMWKYESVMLLKMLDPNFDHEGEEKLFTYGVPGDETTKKELNPEELVMAQLMGMPEPEIVKERVYHNYFQKPRKPYYFFGYDQWGKTYLDETSRIEQNIRNQENLDDQNKTILDQLKSRVKHIWGGESGLRKADIQRLDMDNPKMDVRVEGDPNKVHKAIEPERPDAAQFNALNDTRSRMYAISGSTAVRGKLQSDVATTNQIAREADFTRSDDLVEDTINAACEWSAEWDMHFIKLRYTSEHMRQISGPKGEMTYIRLRRDSVSDGMEVTIKASSTDKMKAMRNAMDTAKLGPPYTNPIDFFKDMDMADPEGRTERGMMLALDPAGYFTKFVMALKDVPAMDAALNGTPQAQPPMPGQPPVPQAGAPNPAVAGQPQAPPQQPTPTDTTQVPTEQPAFPQGSPRAL